MAGATPLFPLRTALLSSALVALLGACAPERDAAHAPPMAEPASPTVPAGQADDASSTAPAADPAGPASICNADRVQHLVGQQATETVTAQATAESGATSVRVLGPDDAATMDFRGDRLNILTDATGVIQSLGCG